VFAEYTFQGEDCLYAGEPVQLTGKAKLLLPKGREESAEQGLTFTSGYGELKWGSAEITLGGSVKLKLTSGKAWSFH
jgi:hypothetical protein